MSEHSIEAAKAHLQHKVNVASQPFKLAPKMPKWSTLTGSERRSLLSRSAFFLLSGWLIIEYIASRPSRSYHFITFLTRLLLIQGLKTNISITFHFPLRSPFRDV